MWDLRELRGTLQDKFMKNNKTQHLSDTREISSSREFTVST